MKTKLSGCESTLYFFIWISANYYALYKLYQAQTDILKGYEEHPLPELKPGWSAISRHQDVSDIEWSTWKFFFSKSWRYLIIQFVISETLRQKLPFLLLYWYIVSSAAFMITNFGFMHLGIVIVQPLIFGIITFNIKNKLSVWITGIALLMSYNSIKYKELLWNIFDHNDLEDEEVYLLLFSIGWIELRCISFCLDFLNLNNAQKEKRSVFQDFLHLFSYVLYLPWLYMGPLILYSEFESSLTVRNSLYSRIKRFVVNIFLYLLYTLLLDLAFHYIYFLAMQENVEMIRKLPTMALCGGGLWMGLEFHLKYVIAYGTTGSFALLDNIKPPPTPRCIARVHVYSEMWRYFDVGLYKFLIKYIYKPATSIISRYIDISTTYKLMASLATFIFIFLWHGTTWAIFVWSLLNFIGITCEHLGRVISETGFYKVFKEKVLVSDAMEQRFVAFLCAPLLALSAISNFYLFAGYEIGSLFFECVTRPALYNSIILLVSLYSCCHVSMILKDVPSRTARYEKEL